MFTVAVVVAVVVAAVVVVVVVVAKASSFPFRCIVRITCSTSSYNCAVLPLHAYVTLYRTHPSSLYTHHGVLV